MAERLKSDSANSNPEVAEAGLDGRNESWKFRTALSLYVVLGLLVWFTVGDGKVLVDHRLVEIRLIPLIVIGGLALRTVVAHHAAQIRRQDGKS